MVKVWGPFMAGRLRPSRAVGCRLPRHEREKKGVGRGLEWEKMGKEPMWISVFGICSGMKKQLLARNYGH